ncbi:MAG TPA: glycosyltransferase family 2 protein [Terriglobia bacterium]|nr:glycosyltransferase family 2 protein [Terriglobia bacterium]
MSQAPIFLSVVLPAYNQAPVIEEVVLSHIDALNGLGPAVMAWEIVCVDDASTDSTRAVLDRLSRALNEVRVVRHPANLGIVDSFATGFAAARGTHIYAAGADGQWPASNLRRMFPALEAGAGLVVGVRPNRKRVFNLKRRLVSFAFNLSTRLLFGVDTMDAGSIKLGVRDVFRFNLISRGPFVEAERIIQTLRAGYKVYSVPVDFNARRTGLDANTHWANVIAGARDCLKCAVAYGFKRRPAANLNPQAERHEETE